MASFDVAAALHAQRHAATGEDPITPEMIGALADGYVPAWGDVTDKPTAFAPSGHAGSHGVGGGDPITPASIGAVPDQDTGWRDIKAAVSTDPAVATVSHALLVREGHRVNVYLDITLGSPWTASGREIVSIPLGFRPRIYHRLESSIGGTPRIVYTEGGTLSLYYAGTGRVFINVTWRTDETFPTTLPGTPA